MASWFPSAFWFILSLIFDGVILVLFMIMAGITMTKFTMKVFVITLISLFLLSITFLGLGFRAPDRLVNITISGITEEKIQNVVKNAVEARVKALTDQYKYELIAEEK